MFYFDLFYTCVIVILNPMTLVKEAVSTFKVVWQWVTLYLSTSRNLYLRMSLLVVSAPPLGRCCACWVWTDTRGEVSEPGPLSVLPLSRGAACLRLCGSPVPKNRSGDSFLPTWPLTAADFCVRLCQYFSIFRFHRACYNSTEWLRYTSVHHHHHHHHHHHQYHHHCIN